MESFLLEQKKNPVAKHLLYWTAFVLFFGFYWGLADDGYGRNILIQICCLPARLLLVYVALYVLFPLFLEKNKFVEFCVSYFVLMLLISTVIQRPLMIWFIQPVFIPGWKNHGLFIPSEIMNSALDINLAALIPLGYRYLETVVFLEQKNHELLAENQILKENHHEALAMDKLHPTNINDRKETHGQQTAARQSDSIELKVDKTIQKLILNEILYVESLRNRVRIKLKDSEIMVLKTISSVQEMLPGESFLRVHRSFLVNTHHINAFSPTKIEIAGATIPVGRKYKDEVKLGLGYA
ncbi:MAG: LytTR family DNA-binding domain-containing protein [Edaphocola sp.]